MRTIEQIKQDIENTKRYIQERKNAPRDWRIGRDMYDREMVAERDEFFRVMKKTNEIFESEKPRIEELSKNNHPNDEELQLLKEHHQLLLELIINFY